jgi:putative ABC transport system permease protein
LSYPVLGFTAAVSLATAIICGLAPAFEGSRGTVQDALKDGARQIGASVRHRRIRQAFVVGEIALAVVLLVGAGLMIRSFWRLTAYPPGFTPERVLTMKIQFTGPRYRDAANRREYVGELLRRAGSAPGVEAAGVNARSGRILMYVEGAPDVPRDLMPNARISVTSASYADAIGMRVVKGRWMRDEEPGPVYVMNESLVRRFFPGRDPIGLRVRLPWINDKSFATVVGVVADLRYSNLDEATEPELFTDYKHGDPHGMTLMMRTAGDPSTAAPAIRTQLAGIDRTQPLFDVKPLDVALADSIAPRRFNLLLLSTFAGSALLLALVGIYGVIAYSVAQRTHEIGVRMALGAQRREVVRMVVRQGMAIALAGIVIGVAAALALTRVIASLLYDVTPTDPGTFAVVASGLAITAFAACCGPALKAALVDPIVALRCE